MLWIAALLSFIIWVLGWQSGFLGPVIHVFLLLALLAVLAALLPSHASDNTGDDQCNDQATAIAEPRPGGMTPDSDTADRTPAKPRR
ncbi:MAG TPA: hypothetical protein VFU78_01595 [Thermomicrobiales bacterium]|nr:hypothetical protein [Thermomicrobiales bacterium]